MKYDMENKVKNFIRITFGKYGSWLFTGIEKAVQFLDDVMRCEKDLIYDIDFLTEREISSYHHEWEFNVLHRIDCEAADFFKMKKDFDELHEGIRKMFENIVNG